MSARIAIVDNDEPMREFLCESLGDEGWQVFGYAYEHVKLGEIQQVEPDIIILDFSDPEGGASWEFLQLLKMEDKTANIPILIMTVASQMSAELQGYLLTRYIQVVHKPFDLAPFVQIIQQTISLASQVGVLFSSDNPLPVLVVDDSEDFREEIAYILSLEGYQVATAGNGLGALGAVYHAQHCLIVLDIEMPGMDGLEFLKVYNRQLRPHAPVVVVSGMEDVNDQTFPPFVIGVIPKPFEVTRLMDVVKKYALPA